MSRKTELNPFLMFGIVVGAICLGGIALFLFMQFGPKSAETPAIKITAESLYDEYDANEIAADQRYKGHVLEVSGTIHSIGKAGSPYVQLDRSGPWPNPAAICYFDSSNDAGLARLSKGDRIVIRGKCTGRSLASVSLRECRIN